MLQTLIKARRIMRNILDAGFQRHLLQQERKVLAAKGATDSCKARNLRNVSDSLQCVALVLTIVVGKLHGTFRQQISVDVVPNF